MGSGSVNWRERPFDAQVVAELVAAGQDELLARLLSSRGVTADEVEAYFDPSLKRLIAPEKLPGIAQAVDVIVPFIRADREIIVFGDYDADGVCASAILVSTLRKLGATHVDAFIPERFGEGYGITPPALDRLFREHPNVALVITVDNGITAAAEIAKLRARGLTVVVTDHHLPPAPESADQPAPIPVADALVDPKVASCEGCDYLCGSGVAFFLARALVDCLRAEAEAKGILPVGARLAGPLMVLTGLATVADLMPLRGQNRVLVSAAVMLFHTTAPIGLRELLERASRRADLLCARDFAFLIAPRLNAAGRMASAYTSYELLMTTDREEARQLAMKVDEYNIQRKAEETRMDQEAREQIVSFDGLDALVVADSRRKDNSQPWNSGVAGIVAARLLEDAHVPVAVVVTDHGSCRAPEGYNVREALDASAEALTRYGGHAAAGGFTVREGMLDEFERLFAAACAARKAAVPDAAAILFDGWVTGKELTMEFLQSLKTLEPIGEGNPEPVFGLKGVFFTDARPIGMEGRHAVFDFAGRTIPRAVWWGHGADAELIRAHAAVPYDVLFTVTESDFGTEGPHVELRIVAMRQSL